MTDSERISQLERRIVLLERLVSAKDSAINSLLFENAYMKSVIIQDLDKSYLESMRSEMLECGLY